MCKERDTHAEPGGMEGDDFELIPFQLITAAGIARSMAFEALKAAREGNFELADELMKKSNEAGKEAHDQQTKILAREAAGDHTDVNVLMVHAQDHLMTAMLAQELIAEDVRLYKRMAGVE